MLFSLSVCDIFCVILFYYYYYYYSFPSALMVPATRIPFPSLERIIRK
jgi:hypothetical protein